VLQLGKLHLQLALAAAGALREDVDDQLGAVRDPDLPEPLQVALLDSADRMVEDNQRDPIFLELGGKSFGGAAAEIEGGIRSRPANDLAQRGRQAGGTGQGIELVEAVDVEAFAVGCNR
jgi:hypothetical protein